MAEPFSLLLPVYAKDKVEYFTEAFRSTVDEQQLRPDQVVVVRDGPVPAELAAAIDEMVAASPVEVDVLALPVNVGLARALDAGLEKCRFDVVARMDADDVSEPDRFAAQLPFMAAGADIVGSGLLEFGAADARVRRVAVAPTAIRAGARFASPFNHPSVVYRRSTVQAVGGYGTFPLMEDYLLWAKLLMHPGVQVANVDRPLVRYRISDGAYARRGGRAQFRAELALQREFRRIGFTSRVQYLRNVIGRGAYRLVPEAVRKVAFRLVTRVGKSGIKSG